MSVEKVRKALKQWNLEDKIIEFDVSSATVELAAQALSCEPSRIAKSLSFKLDDKGILIVTAGDAKVDNKKFKKHFGIRPKMLTFEEVEEMIGHAVGGVCPFSAKEDVKTYLDISLKRFDIVYPAAGTSNSAVELTIEQLEQASNPVEWVDVCKGW